LEMGEEHGRELFESSGWLAAHRRSESWLKRRPVHFRNSSLAGKASSACPLKGMSEWHTWGLRLFKGIAVPPEEPVEP